MKTITYWLDENRKLLIRIVLIVSVISACVLLAPAIALGNRFPTLLLLLILATSFFMIILRWPIVGLISILVGGMFLPFSWKGGFNLSQLSIVAVLGAWFVNMLVVKRKIQIAKSRVMLPVLLFALISLLSFFIGQFSWYPFARNAPSTAQIGGLAINLLSIAAFLLVAHLVNDVRKLEFLTWTFIGCGSIYIIGRFFKVDFIDRVYQIGFSAGSMYWTWLGALLAGQVIANRQLKSTLRVLLGVMLIMTFYVAIVQAYSWRSGWFPLMIAVAVIIAIRYWRRARYFAIFALIPLYFIITASIGQEDWSWGTRLDAWAIVLSIASVSPILGMGFANYYWYTPLFPIRGYAVHFNSHSQFVDLIAQTGVLGLGCFIWIFVEISNLILKLIKTVPEGFAKGYLFAAIGGVAGSLVAAYLVDWILPFVYNIGMNGFRASVLMWIFLGGVVSIEQILRQETTST